jgi:hypothetical protein
VSGSAGRRAELSTGPDQTRQTHPTTRGRHTGDVSRPNAANAPDHPPYQVRIPTKRGKRTQRPAIPGTYPGPAAFRQTNQPASGVCRGLSHPT